MLSILPVYFSLAVVIQGLPGSVPELHSLTMPGSSPGALAILSVPVHPVQLKSLFNKLDHHR